MARQYVNNSGIFLFTSVIKQRPQISPRNIFDSDFRVQFPSRLDKLRSLLDGYFVLPDNRIPFGVMLFDELN